MGVALGVAKVRGVCQIEYLPQINLFQIKIDVRNIIRYILRYLGTLITNFQ